MSVRNPRLTETVLMEQFEKTVVAAARHDHGLLGRLNLSLRVQRGNLVIHSKRSSNYGTATSLRFS